MRPHRARTVALAMLLAASCSAVGGGDTTDAQQKVVVYPTLVEGLTALRIEITVDGRAADRPLAGSVAETNATGREPTTSFPLGLGLHTYVLSGELTFAGRPPSPVQGRGAVAGRDALRSELTAPSALEKPEPAMVKLVDAVRGAAGRDGAPSLRFGSPVGARALEDAERRLQVRLPAAYRRLLTTFGPFSLIGKNDDGVEEAKAALYPPEQILSVPEWRARVRRAPLDPGDSERARANVAKLAGDFVIGHTFDTVWVVRARTHDACPNGEPSLSAEFLYEVPDGDDVTYEDTDAYSSYFGDRRPRCGDQAKVIHDHVMGVLMEELSSSGRLALVGSSGTLALRYEPDETGSSTLFLSQSSRSR